MLQVRERRERAGTPRMHAPVAGASADRADFYQPHGETGRQATRAKKHQRSRKTRTSFGRNGAFR